MGLGVFHPTTTFSGQPRLIPSPTASLLLRVLFHETLSTLIDWTGLDSGRCICFALQWAQGGLKVPSHLALRIQCTSTNIHVMLRTFLVFSVTLNTFSFEYFLVTYIQHRKSKAHSQKQCQNLTLGLIVQSVALWFLGHFKTSPNFVAKRSLTITIKHLILSKEDSRVWYQRLTIDVR